MGFSQSKKKQIEALNFKIDSINKVIQKDRFSQKSEISSLEIQESKTKYSIDSLNLEIKTVENQISAELNEKQKKEQDILRLKNEINKVRDSLIKTSETNQTVINEVYDIILDSVDFITQYGETKYDFNIDENPQSNPKKSKLNGLFKTYWSDPYNTYSKGKKQVHAVGNYKDGLKTGKWIYYFCDGTIKCEGDFINGKKNGKWINYDICNDQFNYSYNVFDYGYFFTLRTFCSYYQLDNNIKKEIIYFNEGIASDTLYYVNSKNELEFKISRKDHLIFYRNNHQLTNKSPSLKETFCDNLKESLPVTKSSALLVYNLKGDVVYSQIQASNMIYEKWIDSKGKIKFECNYKGENGKCTWYNEKGQIESEFDNIYQTGKFCDECNCQ
jgi:antitoxin component YwqK of YwqJK toxin-antitoxin module